MISPSVPLILVCLPKFLVNETPIFEVNPLSKKRKLPPIQFPTEKKCKLDKFKKHKQRQKHNEHN